jgi:hypothetical protein
MADEHLCHGGLDARGCRGRRRWPCLAGAGPAAGDACPDHFGRPVETPCRMSCMRPGVVPCRGLHGAECMHKSCCVSNGLCGMVYAACCTVVCCMLHRCMSHDSCGTYVARSTLHAARWDGPSGWCLLGVVSQLGNRRLCFLETENGRTFMGEIEARSNRRCIGLAALPGAGPSMRCGAVGGNARAKLRLDRTL